jgi:hypothetical protein
MDLKDYLMGENNNQKIDTKNINKDKNRKKDIKNNIYNPNKHLKDVFIALKNESDNIYFHTWNKLEKGVKQKSILYFLNNESKIYNMNEYQIKENNKYLLEIFNNNLLNKISDVKYDSIKGEIESIPKICMDPDTLLYSIK